MTWLCFWQCHGDGKRTRPIEKPPSQAHTQNSTACVSRVNKETGALEAVTIPESLPHHVCRGAKPPSFNVMAATGAAVERADKN